ncbi:MAG: type II toxin-antitoxin system RelB/DinJ family antitoxin [Ignavibacteriae bacterium]|nr:MAG: type II toxin-antitoxin system RelB/DinJ family antitoxin [Ignavibacteriota bacterium]
MPKNAMIRARTESKLKRETELIFKKLGMTPTEAINIFYNQVRLRKGIPFNIEIPNKITKDTLDKSSKRKNLKTFKTVEDLLTDLKK